MLSAFPTNDVLYTLIIIALVNVYFIMLSQTWLLIDVSIYISES